MPSFLVESYLADTPGAVAEARDRARLTARLGGSVRYVRTTFLPDDETILHLFEAPSATALDHAGRLAGLPVDRIVAALEDPPNEERRGR
jgi:hypothetical protein